MKNKMIRVGREKIHGKTVPECLVTVLECLVTGVIVESVNLTEKSQKDKEVEAGQGQEIGIGVGQEIGGNIGVQAGKGTGGNIGAQVEKEIGENIGAQAGSEIGGSTGVQVGNEKRDIEVGHENGGGVEVGQGIEGRVEVGQERGIIIDIVTNTMMMKKESPVSPWTLKVVNLNPRKGEGQGHVLTVMMDERTNTKNPESIDPEVPQKNSNPAVTKSLVAVRSRDTGLAPDPGGEILS
jgi:hypothetical protein